jgi:hypothetical protein
MNLPENSLVDKELFLGEKRSYENTYFNKNNKLLFLLEKILHFF